jgi:PAS domain S-box-containing protein
MKDDIDIIKELREEEKLGNLKSNSKHSDDKQYEEKIIYKKSGETIHLFDETLKEITKDFNIEDIGEKFEIIFEKYEAAITFADENECIISWNKYAEELLNMNEKELFMRPVETLYPPGEWDKIRKENVRQKGMKYKLETKINRKDKEPLDVELSLCVLKGRETNIAGSIGIIRDITKLKNTERELIESEEKYKTIFENSAVAITLTDENEKIISWNKYAEKLLRLNKNELNMKPVKSLYPPEEWEKIRKKNIRQKGMQHHLETKILRENNEMIDVDISISVLKNHEGKITGSIGVIKDITEQKKIENELEYKHNLLQSLLDNIPDCIYFKDEDSKFINVNYAKAKRVNSNPKNMIGKTEFDFFTEEVAKANLEDDKRVMETKKPIVNKVEKISNENGIESWVLVTKIPRFNKEGKIIGTMGISRDITELKKSEERYKNLFETAIDPIVVLDKQGTFIDANEQVTKTLGYCKEDLIGKKINEVKLITQENLNKSLDIFSKRMNGKEIPSYEVKVIKRNGELIPAEISANSLSENGEIIGDLIIIRDLRDRYKRKEVERELLDSENRFRNIFDATSDILFYLEKDIILDLNETALNLGRFTKQNVIGKTFSELKGLFSEEDIKRHLDAIKHAGAGIKLNDYESDIKSIDDQIYRFLFSADCIRNDKEVKGILIRGRDITQRRRAWKELVKLEEKYRVLAETSADGVITIDPLGRLTYVNPSFEKLCSRRKSQILATLFRDYLSEDSVYFFQQI